MQATVVLISTVVDFRRKATANVERVIRSLIPPHRRALWSAATRSWEFFALHQTAKAEVPMTSRRAAKPTAKRIDLRARIDCPVFSIPRSHRTISGSTLKTAIVAFGNRRSTALFVMFWCVLGMAVNPLKTLR